MMINWFQFSPYSALMGGLIIGLASVLLLMFNGRIAGVSGILGSLLRPQVIHEHAWRIAFVLGLVVSSVLYVLLSPYFITQIDSQTTTLTSDSPIILIVAGLCVGVGTAYASGCTSGHGISGLSRFSKRSLVATICFMTAGFVTVFVMRHVFGGA